MTRTKSNTYQKGRFNPWSIDHLINEVMNSNINELVGKKPDFIQRTPPVNVIESEDEFTLEVAVPGLAKKDIKLNIENGRLILSADIEHKLNENAQYKYRQFAFNKFQRSYQIPKSVDQGLIKATMSHGILVIHLPKGEDQKPREVKIS